MPKQHNDLNHNKSTKNKKRIDRMSSREKLYRQGELSSGDAITDSYYNRVDYIDFRVFV